MSVPGVDCGLLHRFGAARRVKVLRNLDRRRASEYPQYQQLRNIAQIGVWTHSARE